MIKLLRPLTKFTMKVKDFKKTKWNKKHQPLPCIAMEKEDGINCVILIEDGFPVFYTREGKLLANMHKFTRELGIHANALSGFMVNCEVRNKYFTLEELGAVIKSTRKKKLSDEDALCHENGTYLVAFDIVPIEDFIRGQCDIPFHQRLLKLNSLRGMGFHIPAVTYCNTEEEVISFFEHITESKEGEGIVRVMPDSPWVAGYKNHYKTKMVCGVDYDLLVEGIEEGIGKRANMVANLIVRWRKYGDASNPVELIPVDGRMDDATRIRWFNNPSEIVGKIVHVHALKIGSQGGLRLAKVHEVRIDKSKEEL